jgi:inner membrane protein
VGSRPLTAVYDSTPMPSAITHAFVGGAISTLAPRRFRVLKLGIVLAVAAALPDLDVLAFRFGIPYSHPLGHRGFSHSLSFALLLAVTLWAFLTRGTSRLSRSSGALFLVVFLACASHGFLDAFTDAGLGVGFFIPFSNARYFFPWRPVVTSPLSIERFFSAEGAAVLRSEALWVWAPIGALAALAALVRRLVVRRSVQQPDHRPAPN